MEGECIGGVYDGDGDGATCVLDDADHIGSHSSHRVGGGSHPCVLSGGDAVTGTVADFCSQDRGDGNRPHFFNSVDSKYNLISEDKRSESVLLKPVSDFAPTILPVIKEEIAAVKPEIASAGIEME